MLRIPRLRALPTLSHRLRPHWHPAEEAAARPHRLILRAHAIYHRGQGAPELRQEGGIQREVSPSAILLAGPCFPFFPFSFWSQWGFVTFSAFKRECLTKYLKACLGTYYSVSDPNPYLEYGSGSRRAKVTHKSRNKLRNVMFWSAWCSLLRAEGFFCNFDVLYIVLIKKKLNFFRL